MTRVEKMGAMLEAWNSGDMEAYARLAGGEGSPSEREWYRRTRKTRRFRGEERYVAICPDGHRAREEGKSKSRSADNARLYCWSCGKRTAIVVEFRETVQRDEASRGKRR